MWRWILRAYVSFMLFWVLLFCAMLVLKELCRLLAYTFLPGILEWVGTHVFPAALLVGIVAGQAPVNSRFTGEKWFRSKDGNGFEDLKLETLRPWTWLMLTPIAVLGLTLMFLEQRQSVFSDLTFGHFLSELFLRSCADIWARKYWFDESCNVQSVLIVPWIASIGYSIAPAVQRFALLGFSVFRNSREESDV
jgi:hypothetical protein